MKRPLLLAATVLLLQAVHATGTHDDSFTKDGLFKADVNDLKDTQLAAHPDTPLDPTKNVLWCGTLQLAWNEAIDLVGEKLMFATPSPAADVLNRIDFNKRDLESASYVAVADFERNHVEDRIRRALENVFHGAASPELIPPRPANPGPDDFVAYAYLYKNLAFVTPFVDGIMDFGGRPVKEFGFGNEGAGAMTNQALVFDYRSPDDFIVELRTKSASDELILAKVKPGATLEATIKTVLDRSMGHRPEPAGPSDWLSVPKLNFDLRRDFSELEGLLLTPGPAAKIKSKLVVTKVQQMVRFQLNEQGAVLKSEATMVLANTAIQPRYGMSFDKPFLILLKQAGSKRPYFALWVGNTTLLEAAPKEK